MAISMNRWKGKVAIVTGASSGIGEAIAERLVIEGLLVVGFARRKELIDENSKRLTTKDGKLFGVKVDLKREEDILNGFKWVKDNVGPVHILINSAGLYRISSLSDGKTELWKDTFDVNVLALCITTREAIQDMKDNNVDGHIIHINGVSGKTIIWPTLNTFGASRHALTALTETLRQELNSTGSKIKISSISPGYVRTMILENSYKECGVEMPEDVMDFVSNAPRLETQDIADAAVYILSTPPHVQPEIEEPEKTVEPAEVTDGSPCPRRVMEDLANLPPPPAPNGKLEAFVVSPRLGGKSGVWVGSKRVIQVDYNHPLRYFIQ